MKKYLFMLVALMATMFSASAFAATFTPPSAPANGWYVLDQAGKLTPQQMDSINRKILATSKATQNEFGVLIVQTLGDSNIEDATNATFKAWGVGKKGLDNGVLLVIAVAERKSRIETGKGVGGEITDVQTQDIQVKNLRPFLKQNDFAGGINATLDALSSLMVPRAPSAVAKDLGTRSLIGGNVPSPQPQIITPPVVAAQPIATNSSPNNNDAAGMFLLGLLGLLAVGGAIVAFVSFRSATNQNKQAELKRLAAQQRQAQLERERLAKLAAEQQARTAQATNLRQTAPTLEQRPYIREREPKQKTAAELTKAAEAATLAAELEAARLARRREAERREQARLDREREREEERAAAAAALAAAAASVFTSSRNDDDDDDDDSPTISMPDFGGGGGGDTGGGFGGGDSGGGGSSSDW